MPGPVHVPVLPITITATGALVPYRFVGHDGAQAGAGENTLGVSTHVAAIGDDVTVEVSGLISIETGAAVTAGSLVEADVTGRAIDNDAGVAVARALDGSDGAGEFVRCILLPN
jgi:hypothetical protein